MGIFGYYFFVGLISLVLTVYVSPVFVSFNVVVLEDLLMSGPGMTAFNISRKPMTVPLLLHQHRPYMSIL